MTRLFETATRDKAAIAARHPRWFRPLAYQLAVPAAVVTALITLALYATARLEFSFARLAGGLGKLAHMVSLMLPPSSGPHPMVFVRALGETLSIALLGTLTAAVLAFPLGILAAKTVVRHRLIHGLIRRVLDVIRGVDVLIWALIFINVVGLGPFAGILAIAASDCGTLGKLFSEAIETSDRTQIDVVVAAGGSRLHVVRLALMPSLMPVLASQVLYYFESNTRSATIIGIVGAGGIGLHLAEQIRVLEWQRVSFLSLMILLTVMGIDWVSRRLRLAMMGQR
jgi:phosphonate transport system permease protein